MAITLAGLSAAQPAGPAVCAAGRWVTHEEWPGWRGACEEPGVYDVQPPYVLRYWHAWDLGERSQAEAERGTWEPA